MAIPSLNTNTFVIKVKVDGDEGSIISAGIPSNTIKLSAKEHQDVLKTWTENGVYYAQGVFFGGDFSRFAKVWNKDDSIFNIVVSFKDASVKSEAQKFVRTYCDWMKQFNYAIDADKLFKFLTSNKNLGKKFILFAEEAPISYVSTLVESLHYSNSFQIEFDVLDGYEDIPKEFVVDVSELNKSAYPEIIEYNYENALGEIETVRYYPLELKEEYEYICSLIENAVNGHYFDNTFITISGMTGDGKTAFMKAVSTLVDKSFFVSAATVTSDEPDALFVEPVLNNATVTYKPRTWGDQDIIEFLESNEVRMLCIDELTRARNTVHNGLMNLLDDSRLFQLHDRYIKVGKNLIILTTQNRGWEYSGTNSLDAAILTRATISVRMPLLNSESAKTLGNKIYPEHKDFLKKFYHVLDTINKTNNISFYVSQRIISNAVNSYVNNKNNPKIAAPMANSIKNAMNVWYDVVSTLFGVDDQTINSIREAVNEYLNNLKIEELNV